MLGSSVGTSGKSHTTVMLPVPKRVRYCSMPSACLCLCACFLRVINERYLHTCVTHNHISFKDCDNYMLLCRILIVHSISYSNSMLELLEERLSSLGVFFYYHLTFNVFQTHIKCISL